MNDLVGPHMIEVADNLTEPLVPASGQVVIETAPGVQLHAVAGKALSLARVSLAPHATAPIHRHAHEQVGILIQGQMELEIDGVRYEIRPGDGYVIHSDVPHGAHAGPEGALAVEGFVAPPEFAMPSSVDET